MNYKKNSKTSWKKFKGDCRNGGKQDPKKVDCYVLKGGKPEGRSQGGRGGAETRKSNK